MVTTALNTPMFGILNNKLLKPETKTINSKPIKSKLIFCLKIVTINNKDEIIANDIIKLLIKMSDEEKAKETCAC